MRKLWKNVWKGMATTGICLWACAMTAFASGNIELNPDALRRASESGGFLVMTTRELFNGLDGAGCTVAELNQSMQKYLDDGYIDYYGEVYGYYFSTLNGQIEFDLSNGYGLNFDDEFWSVQDQLDERIDFETGNYMNDSATKNLLSERDAIVERSRIPGTSSDEKVVWVSVNSRNINELISWLNGINNAGQNNSGAAVIGNGWKQADSGEWFYYENGTAASETKIIDGALYYFDPTDHTMAQSEFIVMNNNTYYFGSDGKMVTGWQLINRDGTESWYYFANSGIMWTDFHWIDNELYCFGNDGAMIHNGFQEINGNKYHFNDNWADRGWQKLEENGETNWYYFSMDNAQAQKGYVAGIEGDSYKYFFWQDGYTDQNGTAHPTGALAQGSDMWVFKNGSPVYVADSDGHLYVNTEKEWNGISYTVDETGNLVQHAPYPHIDYSQRALQYSMKQRTNQECGIASIAAMYGYMGLATGTPEQIYNKVLAMNNGQAFVVWGNYSPHFAQSWIKSPDLNTLYEYLKKGKPVIIDYWNGVESGEAYRGHYSVCVGYNGNMYDLERSGFMVLDVADNTVKSLTGFESYYVNQGCRFHAIIPMD